MLLLLLCASLIPDILPLFQDTSPGIFQRAISKVLAERIRPFGDLGPPFFPISSFSVFKTFPFK